MMDGVRTALVTAAVLLLAAGCGSTHSSAPAQRHLVYLAGDDPAKGVVRIAEYGASARPVEPSAIGICITEVSASARPNRPRARRRSST
jgi:hypothetical protein